MLTPGDKRKFRVFPSIDNVFVYGARSKLTKKEKNAENILTPDLFIFTNNTRREDGVALEPFITRLSGLNGLRFSSVSMTNSAIFAVTSDQKFLVGKIISKEICPEIAFVEPKIFKDVQSNFVSSGANHVIVCACIGSKPLLFSWGLNMSCQLGIPNKKCTNGFVQVDLPPNAPIFVKATCGASCTILLGENSTVWVFGNNYYGQLGFNPETKPIIEKPTENEQFEGIPLVEMAAGTSHSLFLTNSGTIYAFGDNKKGQLGMMTNGGYQLELINTLKDVFVSHIVAYKGQSAAIDEYGQLYLWGDKYGDKPTPLDHQLEPDHFIVDVVLGNEYVACLTNCHELIIFDGLSRLLVCPCQSFFSLFQFGDSFAVSCGNNFGIPLLDHYTTIQTRLPLTIFETHDILRHPQTTFLLESKHFPDFLSNPNASIVLETVFSSLSLLNGSFLKVRSRESEISSKSGIDEDGLLSVYLSLLKSNKLMKAVDECITTLLTKVLSNPHVSGVPSRLRYLYIILLHPSMKKDLCEQIWILLFKVINVLKCGEIIKQWIANSKTSTMKVIMENVKDFLGYYIKKGNYYKEAQFSALQFIHIIYLSATRVKAFPYTEYYHSELNSIISPEDELDKYDDDVGKASWCYSKRAPYLLSAEWKSNFVCLKSKKLMITAGSKLYITIDRKNIMGSAIAAIENIPDKKLEATLRKPLSVSFKDEQGVDAGGLRREFFELITNEMVDPNAALFVSSKEFFWFNKDYTNLKYMYLLGIVIGLGIYNQTLLSLRFPTALYKKLRGISVDFSDLEEYDPEVASTMRNILSYEGNVEEDMCLDFSYGNDEIVPGGQYIMVNESNRKEYVDRVIDFIFNISIKAQFEAFQKGFMQSAGNLVLDLFCPEELVLLINGQETLDFRTLEKSAYYFGYDSQSKAVKNFWYIIHNILTDQEKKDLLFFVTGSSRAPIGGLGMIQMKIERDSDAAHVPQAHTCFNQLVLPDIKNQETMLQKLRIAIQNSQGFQFR